MEFYPILTTIWVPNCVISLDLFEEFSSSDTSSWNIGFGLGDDTSSYGDLLGSLDMVSCDQPDADLALSGCRIANYDTTKSNKLHSFSNLVSQGIVKAKRGKINEP